VAVQSTKWVCSCSLVGFMGFWILLGTGMFVSWECCVLSGRSLCIELITGTEESFWLWCVVMYDLETSRMRRPWPLLGYSATKKKVLKNFISVWFVRNFDHPTGMVMSNQCTKSISHCATNPLQVAMSVSPSITYDNPLHVYCYRYNRYRRLC